MFFFFLGDKNTQQYSRTTHCNYLLFELKVLTTILLPFYFITASARNFVYPLKNYTGELYCYVYEYSLLYGLVVYQHLSLFINLFRYICIVHGNTLMSHGISMKVSTYTLSRKKRFVLNFLPQRNEKKKKLLEFSFYINIANFKAFLQGKRLSTNLLFLKSDTVNTEYTLQK